MANLVTLYSAQFQGRFDRNRSDKYTSGPLCKTQQAAIDALRNTHALKQGRLTVTRYDNCEDKGDGLYVIPITRGERVYDEAIGVNAKAAAPAADHSAWLAAKVSACVEAAFALWRHDPSLSLYLWHARGDLIVSAEQPPGLELSDNERLPGNRTREGLLAWINERARRLPCLPV